VQCKICKPGELSQDARLTVLTMVLRRRNECPNGNRHAPYLRPRLNAHSARGGSVQLRSVRNPELAPSKKYHRDRNGLAP